MKKLLIGLILFIISCGPSQEEINVTKSKALDSINNELIVVSKEAINMYKSDIKEYQFNIDNDSLFSYNKGKYTGTVSIKNTQLNELLIKDNL